GVLLIEELEGDVDEAGEGGGLEEVLVDAERFGVRLVAAALVGGDHDDQRAVLVALDLLEHEEAGAFGEHHVENDEVGWVLQADGYRGVPVLNSLRLRPFGDERGVEG